VLSLVSARKAEKLGYKNVKVFHGGLPEWRKSGHIVVTDPIAIDTLEKNDQSYVLLDLRSKAEIDAGHLPKAVALPEKGVDALEAEFPKFKSAPVFLYNKDGNPAAAADAYKKISDWGYKQVSVLQGGYEGWAKAGKTVDKGPALTKIAYVRKPGPGEFEADKFRELVKNPDPAYLILDVRQPSEVKTGTFPNSLSIPLDELDTKVSDVPKDKHIVIHCATGARAEMAYNILKKAGLDAKYVKAKIDFDEKDPKNYTIEE
jgi:rhodanese-related sulfurtransferase